MDDFKSIKIFLTEIGLFALSNNVFNFQFPFRLDKVRDSEPLVNLEESGDITADVGEHAQDFAHHGQKPNVRPEESFFVVVIFLNCDSVNIYNSNQVKQQLAIKSNYHPFEHPNVYNVTGYFLWLAKLLGFLLGKVDEHAWDNYRDQAVDRHSNYIWIHLLLYYNSGVLGFWG